MKHYQVIHTGHIMSFSSGEAKEHQRLYSEKEWENLDRSKRSTNTIDRSRERLNFEIGRGGKILPLGTLPPITERYKQRLAEAGAVDPNQRSLAAHEPARYRTVFEIIFSGDVDIMRSFAFGDQQVDYTPGSLTADDSPSESKNANLVRKPKIEQWATDIYNAVARKYGEENILSFSVHLDEHEPHVHCCIVPIYPYEKHYKDGHMEIGNKIKYRETFGGHRDVLGQLHDYFYEEVNRHYGLDRGESVNETGARHVDKVEYMRSLNRRINEVEERIAQKEKALKGLTTMIENLEAQKTALTDELDAVRTAIAEDNGNRTELQKKLQTLTERLSDVDSKLTDKREKLMDVESALMSYRDVQNRQQQALTEMEIQKSEVKRDAQRCRDELQSFRCNFTSSYRDIVKATPLDVAITDFRGIILPILDRTNTLDEIGDSIFGDWCIGKLKDVIDTATDAITNGIGKPAAAMLGVVGGETYQLSPSGGGSSNTLDRKKDEDDWSYIFRMVQMAHARHNPYRQKKGGRSR